MPILSCLQRVTEGGGADNITKTILDVFNNEGGLIPYQIRD